MNMPKVSIVMPIFNASKFLKQSLGGLVQQTLKDIEIICVNDGSTDDSLALIKEYAFQDERIKIIDKENSGYGNTMNEGIRIATGEYIGILEPDDFADFEMYKCLYSVAKKYNADVVKSNYYEYSQKENNDTFFEVLKGLEYDTVSSAHQNEKIIFMRPCIWSAIYKRSLLLDNHILFNETPGASYQDTAFAFKIWVCAQRVIFVKEAYLHYRIDNENSSVKSSGKIFSICDEFQSMQSFLNLNLENKKKFSKILQALKLDSYTWNLGRIAPEYRPFFKDQIALELIKADYDGTLDKNYFDPERWDLVNTYITEYKNKEILRQDEEKILKSRISELEKSESYRIGHTLMKVPGAIKKYILK